MKRTFLFAIVPTLLTTVLGTAAQDERAKYKELPTLKNPNTAEVVKGQVIVKYNEQMLVASDTSTNRLKMILKVGNELQSELRSQDGTDVIVEPINTIEFLGAQLWRIPQDLSVEQAITRIEQSSKVEYAAKNYRVHLLYNSPPDDTEWIGGPLSLWGMERIGMPDAWKISDGEVDHNTVVGMVDTGLDDTHPDLHPHMWTNSQELSGVPGRDDDHNGIVDDIYGANFCGFSQGRLPRGDTIDPLGHGTAMAGVIGAAVENAQFVAGVHREAKVMALKFVCSDSDGTTLDAVIAIMYAVAQGAAVVNMSWVIGDVPDPVLRSVIQFWARNTLFVAAAGNSTPANNNDTHPLYPANFGNEGVPNIIAVAGTMLECPSDAATLRYTGAPTFTIECTQGPSPEEVIWDESSYGEHSVHIAAPAWMTVTTFPLRITPDGLARGSGTSMAAAHVSGCAALIQAARAKSGTSPLTPRDLKDVLMNNSDRLTSLTSSVVNGNRLNCYQALRTEIKPSLWEKIKKWFTGPAPKKPPEPHPGPDPVPGSN